MAMSRPALLPAKLLLRTYRIHQNVSQLNRGLGTTSSAKTTAASRKQVTIANDDGSVRWGDLSKGEKAARATQQTFNLGVVLLGVVMTSGVFYILYTEVFAPDSKTNHFNRAVDRVKADSRCTEILGPASSIRAYGEGTGNRWTRNRAIASSAFTDNKGSEHLVMHFNVTGSDGEGVVQAHLVKTAHSHETVYQYLFLDVPGQTRVYLEGSDGTSPRGQKMFGVRWK